MNNDHVKDSKEQLKAFADFQPLLISILTLWGYLAAYIYQIGYLRYFDIPEDFIQVNIFEAGLGIIGVLIQFLLIFCLGLILKIHKQEKFFSLFLRVFFMGEILVIGPLFYSYDLKLLLVVIQFFATLIISLGATYLMRREIRNKNRIPTAAEAMVISVIFFILMVNLPFAAGIRAASKRTIYPIIHQEGRDLVVVRTYVDSFIALPRIGNALIEDSIIILNRDKLDEIKINPLKIGPIDMKGNFTVKNAFD